jgi:hypothetical protein
LDASSYLTQDPEKCLIASENEKKRKYQQKCHEQRRTFVPFVVSVDGLLAPEAINSLKQIARKLSDKWQHPYSAIFGYVKSRIGISVICGAQLCLRGSRVHVTAMSNRRYTCGMMKNVSTVFINNTSNLALAICLTIV